MTLNRARSVDQERVLVELDDAGVATVLPRSTVDVSAATGVAEGRLVIDETAAPHDGDTYVIPPPPVVTP